MAHGPHINLPPPSHHHPTMASPTSDHDEPSYIDYETFLSPSFRPTTFANTLVLATNNPDDTPLDLSTPLSRVLFDAQEIDSHIDTLTTRSAIPLLQYTIDQNEASGRIVEELEGHVSALNASYRQLEKEVIERHAEAEEVRVVALRLWETLRIARGVARCLALGRQLEVQFSEVGRREEDHKALVRCARTVLSLREMWDHTGPGEEGHGLDGVDAIRALRERVTGPMERATREAGEKIVREFSMPSAATFSQAEDMRARTVSALVTLYLLSPTADTAPGKWLPVLLLHAMEVYIRTALQSSIASLSRSLAQLPTLDRTLAEISARCQNILAVEHVLESTKPPPHPLFTDSVKKWPNLLQPLLGFLETGSLVSYFWRSMAEGVGGKVQEIVNRGGVAGRTLKSNREGVGEAIRECVVRGSGGKEKGKGGNWDREVAVMVGSVVNNLGR